MAIVSSTFGRFAICLTLCIIAYPIQKPSSNVSSSADRILRHSHLVFCDVKWITLHTQVSSSLRIARIPTWLVSSSLMEKDASMHTNNSTCFIDNLMKLRPRMLRTTVRTFSRRASVLMFILLFF